jgi:hypothetical protein
MPFPPVEHPLDDDDGNRVTDIAARLSEVLRDVAATERGQEKVWLNVQPCVLHTIKLLAGAVRSREARLQQVENTLQQTQECLAVLVRDREVKEERYRLDVAAHKAEMEQLWNRVLYLEAQQQHQLTNPVPMSSAASSKVERRVNVLEQELQRAQYQLQSLHLSKEKRRASPSRHFPPSSSASSSGTNVTDRDIPSSTASSQPTGAGRSSPHSAVTQRMLEEVRHLRRQWRHFLRTIPAAMVRAEEVQERSGSERQDGTDRGRYGRQAAPRSSPSYHCDSDGDGTTSAAVRRRRKNAGARSLSPPPPTLHRMPSHKEEEERSDALSSDTEVYCGEDPHRNDRRWSGGLDPLHGRSPSTVPHVEKDGVWSGLPLSSCGRRVRWWYVAGDAPNLCVSATASTNAYLPRCSPLLSTSPRSQHDGTSGAAGFPPVVPWAEWHAFDGRTDCWYSLGTWATHRDHLKVLRRHTTAAGKDCPSSPPPPLLLGSTSRFGWMAQTTELVSWPRPSCFTVQHGGIYEVRVCVVRRLAAITSKSGQQLAATEHDVLSLWIDGVEVTGLSESVSSTLLYPPTPSSSSPTRSRHRSPPSLFFPDPATDAGQATPTHRPLPHHPNGCFALPQHTHMERAYRALQRRPCCAPARIHTHLLTACLYLPTGVTVQVRCSELHSTTTIHEAFCELTYLV